MSHDILYNRQFIKLSDNRYIPIILGGSNNCYDSRNRRARDWSSYSWLFEWKDVMGTKEQIMDRIKRDGEEHRKTVGEDFNKSYGDHKALALRYAGAYTTFNAYKAFILNGFKTAMTVEELVAKRVFPVVSVSIYDVQKWEAEHGKPHLGMKTCRTEQELVETIAHYKEYYQNPTPLVFFHEYEMDSLLRERFWENKKKRKVEKESVSQDHGFALEMISDPGYYFVKGTRNGFQYSPYDTSAKIFATELEAEKFRKRSKSGYRFKIKRIDRSFLLRRRVKATK